MHRDIAPVHIPTALAALQSLTHTHDDTDTAHDHALQPCSVRHHLSDLHRQHCRRVGPPVPIASIKDVSVSDGCAVIGE